MIDGLKPYPKMKDSGVPWLGQVPEHWEVRRFKYLLRERDERSARGEEQLLRVSQFTGVTERRRSESVDEPDTRAASLVGYKLVEPLDLAVNIMLAWNGSMGVSPFAGIVSPAYCVYRFCRQLQPWYYHHLLRSTTHKARIKALSTGVVESRLRLYTEGLYRLEALLPPLAEQAAIVRFLDQADRRIRRYIGAKQKLIKLLEEQKQAIIHRAVTRGLDLNVRLKPSGVEWLGEVPEHWQLMSLRRLTKPGTSITYGIVQAGPDVEGGVPYIRTSDMRGEELPESGYLRTSSEIDASYSRSKVEPGDLVVAIRATLGKGLLVPDYLAGANLTQGTARVSPGPRLLPRFLLRAFNSPLCQEQIRRVAKGTTFLEITLEALRRVVVTVPALSEQQAIVDYIDKFAALNTAVEHLQREIFLLREYRTRLIADVVTGKLDVREAAARLPDESDEPDPLGEAEIEAATDAADDRAAAPEEADA